jgi:hypothetical protein
MGHRKFNDVVGDINAERRSRIDAIKHDARADAVAYNLAELRRHRQLTQVELAERIERPEATTRFLPICALTTSISSRRIRVRRCSGAR